MAQWESGKETIKFKGQPLEDITQSDTKITYVIKILDIIRKQRLEIENTTAPLFSESSQ